MGSGRAVLATAAAVRRCVLVLLCNFAGMPPRLRLILSHLWPAVAASEGQGGGDETVRVLIIGGLGAVGSGIRSYLPQLDSRYRFTSIDLSGAPDRASLNDVDMTAHPPLLQIRGDISADPQLLEDALQQSQPQLVIYLARLPRVEQLGDMNRMSDHVFECCLRQPKPPMIIAASSIHAIDGPGPGSYSLNDGDLAALAERRFEDLPHGPPVLLLKTLSTVRASGY